MNQHPEMTRASELVAEAVRQLDEHEGDLRSFASCLLTASAELYRLTHGDAGRDGAPAALDRIAAAYRARAQRDEGGAPDVH